MMLHNNSFIDIFAEIEKKSIWILVNLLLNLSSYICLFGNCQDPFMIVDSIFL